MKRPTLKSRIRFLLAAFLSLGWAASESPAADFPFPEKFRWCVATAAHQIEGYNTESDWWDFEQIPGNIKNGDHSGAACDHWNRLEQDTALLQELGVQQYRFSIEWAKLEPREGEIDLDVILHYRRELQLLKDAGIEPMVTLHHFTLPRWVREKGGWEWNGSVQAFKRFTEVVVNEIAPDVRDFITINEPIIHLVIGYLGNRAPHSTPGLPGLKAALPNLLRAHAVSYHALHRQARHAGITDRRVGVAHHLRVFRPKRPWYFLDIMGASILSKASNWSFFDAIETGRLQVNIPFLLDINERIAGLKGTQDFIGINYYTRDVVNFNFQGPLLMSLEVLPNRPTTDVHWEIFPEGFGMVVEAAAKRAPGKPILITENGLADHADTQRAQFLKSHLWELHRLIQKGVPIQGYCHWSLMDNFEWSEGFEPRFGLYEVDYETQERKARPSARLYKHIIQENGLNFTDPELESTL